MEYNRGSSGIVLFDKSSPDIVVKKTKKPNINDEIMFHQTCFDICAQNKFHILRIPQIHTKINNKSYGMEKIDDREMITNPCKSLSEELQTLFHQLENRKIKAFDYELYLQRDGTVFMIDFDKFCWT